MNRLHLVVAVPIALLLAGAAACTSSTAGVGSPSGTFASDSLSSSPTSASSSSSVAPSSSSAGEPTAQSNPNQPASSAPSSATPSPSLTGQLTLAPLTHTDPMCNGATSGTVQATISWMTTNANEIWIESSPIASTLPQADPKTDGRGTLLGGSASGSVNIAFDCANTDYYYLIEAYNTITNSKAGISQQVVRG